MARKAKFDEEIEPVEIIYVSKSELKRDAQSLRSLGDQIVALTANQRAKLPLDEELLYALSVADKISNKKTEGFRRQLQFIGRLLRNRDFEAIQQAMEATTGSSNQTERALQQIEKCRLAVLGDDSTEQINKLVAEYPLFERQKLRQLVKKTHKQQQQQPEQPSPAFKELFQYLKEVIQCK